MKDGDFWEAGDKEDIKPLKMGQRTDLEGAMKSVDEGASELDMYINHTDTMAKFPKFIERYRQLKQESAAIKELHEEYKAWSLWPWQKLLAEKLEMTPDPRKIMWYWSEGGNVGKSAMQISLEMGSPLFSYLSSEAHV